MLDYYLWLCIMAGGIINLYIKMIFNLIMSHSFKLWCHKYLQILKNIYSQHTVQNRIRPRFLWLRKCTFYLHIVFKQGLFFCLEKRIVVHIIVIYFSFNRFMSSSYYNECTSFHIPLHYILSMSLNLRKACFAFGAITNLMFGGWPIAGRDTQGVKVG